MIVTVELKVNFKPDWTPQLDVRLSYQWTSDPKVEIVGSLWIDAKGLIEDPLNKLFSDLENGIKNSIDGKAFRDVIAKLYWSRTFPIKLPNGTEMHVNMTPEGIGFSGLQLEADKVKFAVIIKVKVEISINPLKPEQVQLPPFNIIPVAIPRINIALPVRVPYDILTAALNETVGGQTFTASTPIGQITVLVNAVETYPSDKYLAVGMNLTANLPGKFLDTAGMVYLLAEPVVEGGTRIKLKDLAFSAQLDNDFWNVAAVVLEGPIRDALEKAAIIDLSDDIAKVKESLTEKLKDPATTPGMSMTLTDVTVNLGQVKVAEKEFAIEILFSANVSIVAKL